MHEEEIRKMAKLLEQQAEQLNKNMDMMIGLAKNIAVHKQIIMDIAGKVGLSQETLEKVKELNSIKP